VCTFAPFDGSLTPLLTGEGWRAVAEHWPWPSFTAATIIVVFAVIEATLLRWLPGERSKAPSRPPAIGRVTS
jgi:hypothetical protein